MDLSASEQLVMERFREKTFLAGGPRPGYTLRTAAIQRVEVLHPGVDLGAGVDALVEKGLLKRNPKGDFVYLTAAGVTALADGV